MKWTKIKKVHYHIDLIDRHMGACFKSVVEFGGLEKYNYLCNLNNLNI